jgi:hypothetical protein
MVASNSIGHLERLLDLQRREHLVLARPRVTYCSLKESRPQLHFLRVHGKGSRRSRSRRNQSTCRTSLPDRLAGRAVARDSVFDIVTDIHGTIFAGGAMP